MDNLSCFPTSSFLHNCLLPQNLYNVLVFVTFAAGQQGDGAQGGFNVVAELEKLWQAHQSRGRLEIGELLRVRGAVKTSRQEREIIASTYCK